MDGTQERGGAPLDAAQLEAAARLAGLRIPAERAAAVAGFLMVVHGLLDHLAELEPQLRGVASDVPFHASWLR